MVFKEPAGNSGGPIQGPLFAQQSFGSSNSTALFGDVSGVSADGASYPAIAPRPSVDAGHAAFGAMHGSETYWEPGDQYPTAAYTYMNQPYSTTTTAPSTSYATHDSLDAYNTSDFGNLSNDFPISNAIPDADQSELTTTTRDTYTNDEKTITNGWPYSPISPSSQITQPSPTHVQFHFSRADTTGRQLSQHPPPQASIQTRNYNSTGRASSTAAGLHFRESNPRTNDMQAQQFLHQRVKLQDHAYRPPAEANSWEEEPVNDWFDVESEDEDPGNSSITSPRELGLLIAKSAQKGSGNLRSTTNFLSEPNALSAYNPAYAASPLRDAQTARVFCHFVTATGPTLHACERNRSNPSVIFSGHPVPKSQQSLWSYTLPMLALHHQGLLHAMLALSSLHIAKLQQSSPTPSLRHYHYALRRVAKSLGNQKKRRDPATLAATLLLGFYEVTTAEHNKWNSHLSGARELVMDIPFAKMSKKVEAYRCQQEEAEASAKQMQKEFGNGLGHPRRIPSGLFSGFERKLDKGLISTITGWEMNYEDHGEVSDANAPASAPEPSLTPADIDEYEVQLDLFWWYAKQDMYQSVISGNRLL